MHGAIEIDLGYTEIAAAFGEEFAHEAVIGLVLAEGGADPVMVGLGGVRPEIDGKLSFDAMASR